MTLEIVAAMSEFIFFLRNNNSGYSETNKKFRWVDKTDI